MRDTSEVLEQARIRAHAGDIDGAILLLKDKLAAFSGQLRDRRRIVSLLLAYCGRQERFAEGLDIGAVHLEFDPPSVIDSSIKARIVMNYAALMAASGSVDHAKSVLGDILLCARMPIVSKGEIARVNTMFQSLEIVSSGVGSRGPGSYSLGSRSAAYLATAHINRLIENGSFADAVQLSQDVLSSFPLLEDGALKATLLLNMAVGLRKEGRKTQEQACLKRSYAIATRCPYGGWNALRNGGAKFCDFTTGDWRILSCSRGD